jgi:hypothetical protein
MSYSVGKKDTKILEFPKIKQRTKNETKIKRPRSTGT